MAGSIKMELPPLSSIPLIRRREAEALFFRALIDPLCDTFEKERLREVLSRAITEEARKEGRALREHAPSGGCEIFQTIVAGWNRGDTLEYNVLERSPERFAFRVSRCAFAEMYQRLGLAEWGFILSCQRDFAFLEGFNPEARLFRPHTLMEGHGFCDFDYRFPPIGKEEDAKK
ncbi:MAG TPA: L-2-amino-thiazoline-4-carboxylic acid hydrolase [Synergistaceae bacterium]|nr:L-2-amino-thiazoline-4-carboxylic acid hydrolase [Synergistaceae bacterium]HPQ36439.1 L-2-amino-thiazoline-4-carboxylic acid hydrolase [Synergistaceae bacterium]